MELIQTLIDEKGEARAVDLAERLGISPVTVTKTVRRLKQQGYVTNEPYRSIFLTKRGEEIAARSRERHAVVLRFLEAIGVPAEVAEHDAEGIEHHVSGETLNAMRRFTAKTG